ncbi:MAG: ECF transporter S component [Lachnospiraceae bacterium]|nr:ECF transporter S component [Lachnospiraceae bacterium]
MNRAMVGIKFNIKAKLVATILAVFAAVALPQLCHLIGGAPMGTKLLPMHLPVIVVGFLAGPLVGGVVGALSPIISFMLTGMPAIGLLPFMVIELYVYGVCAGLLKSVEMPVILKVLAVQIAGRAVRALAILVAVGLFKFDGIKMATIWTSIPAGLTGLIIQWVGIPVLFMILAMFEKNEK